MLPEIGDESEVLTAIQQGQDIDARSFIVISELLGVTDDAATANAYVGRAGLCACVRGGLRICMHVCMWVGGCVVCVYMCVRACVWSYVCVGVCVCVCGLGVYVCECDCVDGVRLGM